MSGPDPQRREAIANAIERHCETTRKVWGDEPSSADLAAAVEQALVGYERRNPACGDTYGESAPAELAARIAALETRADEANTVYLDADSDTERADGLRRAIEADRELGLAFGELRRYLSGPARAAARCAHTWCADATNRGLELVAYLRERAERKDGGSR